MSLTQLEDLAGEEFVDDESLLDDFDDEDFDDDEDVEELFADDFGLDEDDFDDEDFDDEDFDDEGFDPESMAERRFRFRRRRRRMPRFRRRRSKFRSRGRPRFRRAKGRRTTRLRTATGQTARVNLGTSFATAKDLNAFKAETKKAIANARKETRDNFTKLDTRLNNFTKTLDKKINTVDADHRKTRARLKKVESSSRMSGLLPLLMGSPKIENLDLGDGVKIVDKDGKAVEALPIDSVKYKDDNNMLLPLLLTSGAGGGGGMNDTALLAIALMK